MKDDTCSDGGRCDDLGPTALTDACVGSKCQRPDAGRDAGRGADPAGDVDSEEDTDPLSDAQAEVPPPERESQCAVDEDCAELGLFGARCVERACWQPPGTGECVQASDCTERGPEYVDGLCIETACRPNPRWRCERPQPPDTSGQLTLHILVRDSLSLSPISDVRATACQKLDLDCVDPVAEATTEADGMLSLEVPHDLAGYIKLERARYAPALYFLPPVLPADGQLQPAPLLLAGMIDVLALTIGSPVDPKRGHMMLISEDCFGASLPGITFSSAQRDDKTIQFYVRDLLPVADATETGEIGNGGYLNFPAGVAVIDVTRREPELKLTTSSVLVRSGFISVAYIRPDLR